MCKSIFIVLALGTLAALLPAAQGQEAIEAWVARYNGPGNDWDHANDLAVDDSGNVFVTGWSGGSGTGRDYTTFKYDPVDGDTLWAARYNYNGNMSDEAFALALDDSGNVYVTGYSCQDYATVKYDPDGTELWVARYNGPGNGWDTAYALAVDDSGNVYVTGYSDGGDFNYDYATIKYDPDGNEQWVARYNGPGNDWDFSYALAVDDSGNVYVTGASYGSGTSNDYATIKYDPADGDTLWVARYNGPVNSADNAKAIALDDSGNVCVTGYSEGSGTLGDCATIKYDPTDGDTLWVARYNGPGNSSDLANALAVDNSGNVYVTGLSEGSGTDADYATIKYDTDGNELWAASYDGPVNLGDEAYALAIDDSGYVYVTGESTGSGGLYDYATIKYDPADGDTLWVARYNGPGNHNDCARALAVDDSGNVYVTGWSYESGTLYDYVTIKYSEIILGIENDPFAAVPIEFSFRGPYPNPFNPVTTFKVELPVASWVTLEIYDITGRTQGSPLQGWRKAGYHEVTFDASGLASGVYVYRLEAGEYKASGKMVLMK
jgi:hypothetical protein